jgi:hypothetical protein
MKPRFPSIIQYPVKCEVRLGETTFYGANRVQAGLDVSFDIFITIAWFFFGINMARHPAFKKWFAWMGSAIAFVLLVLNMITFPDAPAESGLIDVGPFLGLWAFAAYIWFTLVVRKSAREKSTIMV